MKIANIDGELVIKYGRKKILDLLKDKKTQQELENFLQGTSKEILIKFCGNRKDNKKKEKKIQSVVANWEENLIRKVLEGTKFEKKLKNALK